jgi:hypothetical protein
MKTFGISLMCLMGLMLFLTFGVALNLINSKRELRKVKPTPRVRFLIIKQSKGLDMGFGRQSHVTIYLDTKTGIKYIGVSYPKVYSMCRLWEKDEK